MFDFANLKKLPRLAAGAALTHGTHLLADAA
jgi:hypothetical protein